MALKVGLLTLVQIDGQATAIHKVCSIFTLVADALPSAKTPYNSVHGTGARRESLGSANLLGIRFGQPGDPGCTGLLLTAHGRRLPLGQAGPAVAGGGPSISPIRGAV